MSEFAFFTMDRKKYYFLYLSLTLRTNICTDSNKFSKLKNKTLPLGLFFVKLQGSKKFHYVEDSMESEAHGHESDDSYRDVDFEETIPN